MLLSNSGYFNKFVEHFVKLYSLPVHNNGSGFRVRNDGIDDSCDQSDLTIPSGAFFELLMRKHIFSSPQALLVIFMESTFY